MNLYGCVSKLATFLRNGRERYGTVIYFDMFHALPLRGLRVPDIQQRFWDMSFFVPNDQE